MGESTVAARLADLGFEVISSGSDWMEKEVRAAVVSYFEMLKLQAAGERYNKSEYNRLLRITLRSRSKGSIELKHQNISAVLNDLDLPTINGYKPRANAQELLRQEVQNYVVSNYAVLEGIISSLERVAPVSTENFHYAAALVKVPPNATRTRATSRTRIPRHIDFVGRDARNHSLGEHGERWAIEYEKARLISAGRSDLAAEIQWISNLQGDGAGYDILSKDTDGSDLFIEVKTTNGAVLTPFVLTINELECSRELGSRYCLYRIFSFSENPRIFIVRGPLDEHLLLDASEFRARFSSSGQPNRPDSDRS